MDQRGHHGTESHRGGGRQHGTPEQAQRRLEIDGFWQISVFRMGRGLGAKQRGNFKVSQIRPLRRRRAVHQRHQFVAARRGEIARLQFEERQDEFRTIEAAIHRFEFAHAPASPA